MTVRFGAFALDPDSRQLTRDGVEIRLTPKAFDLLVLLTDEAPRVVRKTELHQQLWPRTFVSDATLASLVKELRRALDDRDPRKPIVRTAYGVGYSFAAQVDRAALRPTPVKRWIVAGSRRIPLVDGPNLIGRDPLAAVFLDVAGVSRRHAEVVVRDGGAVLEDVGSKNGTQVQDTPVKGKVALHDGDSIQVGPVVVIYHASESGMPTETVVLAARARQSDKKKPHPARR